MSLSANKKICIFGTAILYLPSEYKWYAFCAIRNVVRIMFGVLLKKFFAYFKRDVWFACVQYRTTAREEDDAATAKTREL
jgi:hypothetical protein